MGENFHKLTVKIKQDDWKMDGMQLRHSAMLDCALIKWNTIFLLLPIRNRLDPATVIPAKAGIQTDFVYP
jgi:hypothetical protein